MPKNNAKKMRWMREEGSWRGIRVGGAMFDTSQEVISRNRYYFRGQFFFGYNGGAPQVPLRGLRLEPSTELTINSIFIHLGQLEYTTVSIKERDRVV